MNKKIELTFNTLDLINTKKIQQFINELDNGELINDCERYAHVNLIKEFNYLNFSDKQLLNLSDLYQDSVVLYFRMKLLGVTDFDYYSLGIIIDSVSNYFEGYLANNEHIILNEPHYFHPDDHQYWMDQLDFLIKFKGI
jgi:hypothetical protein